MTKRKFVAVLYWFFATAYLLGAANIWAQDMRKLVLVVASGSDINRLSPADTRKLFLGVPINFKETLSIGGETLRPLRNTTDPVLEEAFLQKVIFMSRDAYERALLTRVMHGGGTRPALYDSETALVNALLADKSAVTYMWAGSVSARSNLKIVAELWQ